MNGTSSETLLVSQFRAFYGEVLRLKRLVTSGTWATSATSPGDEDTVRTQTVTAVWQRLLSLLEQQELVAGRYGGEYGAMFYKEAQYVMAALADETFLHLDWCGKAAWQTQLLEARLFGSQSAGEVLFQKLERLLNNRDPVYAELNTVYLMALALGFQGKFRGSSEAGQLADYRRRLYAGIAHRKPDLLSATRQLCPEAHAHTLVAGQAGRLPTARPWFVLLAGVMLLFWGLTHLLWAQLTDDLHKTIAPILRSQ